MATDRSDTLYFSWREAQDKFDYFTTGAALALLGYIVPNLEPARLGAELTTWIEVAAATALLVSAYAGMKRIEAGITTLGANYAKLRAHESAGALSGAAMSGGSLINKSTGEVLSAAQAMNYASGHFAQAAAVDDDLRKWAAKAEFWYKIRNWFIVLGLLLLILAHASPMAHSLLQRVSPAA